MYLSLLHECRRKKTLRQRAAVLPRSSYSYDDYVCYRVHTEGVSKVLCLDSRTRVSLGEKLSSGVVGTGGGRSV